MPAAKASRRDPKTGRSVPRVVHELFLDHQPDDYRRGDLRLRLVGGAGALIAAVGVAVWSGTSSIAPAVATVGVGVAVFAVALFVASRRYKRAYREFIHDHMADDGTFLFCPNCRYDLAGQAQHKLCPQCGTKPWVFTQGK